ncbi:MAG: GNAT family N-acetyltransferase [Chloroflexi bacterium]|nr:GNAT family N-acetyltransferase [Chloroflexota bacterium]
MSLEIRQITDDEVEAAEFITAYSFNSPERRDLAKAVERAKKLYPANWSLASFEDGEMTAFVRSIPFAARINGRGLSYAAVGPVVSLPQHRRKGHVGAILRQLLQNMRENGQVLSGLHTPHPTLYQRYGWEIASLWRTFKFPPKEIQFKSEPKERGYIRMLKADDWAQADHVYRQHSGKRNGALHRGEVWWREAIFGSGFAPDPSDVALWEDASGEPQGYVVYVQPARPQEDMAQFWVREIVALTTDAYLNLLLYIVRHDLPREIAINAAPDDPFLSLVEDARHVKIKEGYDLMNRIVDVEAALKLRPPAHPELELEFTIQLSDRSAPWNEGTWLVKQANGEVAVEKTDGEPNLTMSTTTLAPLYNGFLTPTAAAFAGRIEADSEESLAIADAFFATLHPPFCSDGF